jgi:predicted secreted Zn-dependent protease
MLGVAVSMKDKEAQMISLTPDVVKQNLNENYHKDLLKLAAQERLAHTLPQVETTRPASIHKSWKEFLAHIRFAGWHPRRHVAHPR